MLEMIKVTQENNTAEVNRENDNRKTINTTLKNMADRGCCNAEEFREWLMNMHEGMTVNGLTIFWEETFTLDEVIRYYHEVAVMMGW